MPSYGEPNPEYIKTVVQQGKERQQGRNRRVNGVRTRRLQLREPKYPGGDSGGVRLATEGLAGLTQDSSGGSVSRQSPFADYISPHRSSVVRDTGRRGQSILAIDLPRPSIPPTGRTGADADPDEDIKRERVAKALRALYIRCMVAQRGATWFKITDSDVHDGEAIWKVLDRKDLWVLNPIEGESDQSIINRADARKRKYTPIVILHVPTLHFYPLSEDIDGYCEIVEVSKRSVAAVATEFGLTVRNNHLESIGRAVGSADDVLDAIEPIYLDGSEVEFWEYHNRDTIVYLINQKVVKTVHHRYGRVPYFHALFSPNSMEEPEFQTESLVAPILSLQDDLDDVVTALKTWVAITSYPPAAVEPANELAEIADSVPENIEWGPGLTTHVPGHTWGFKSPPPMGVDSLRLMDYLLGQLRDTGLADILKGLTEASRLSGPASLQLIQIARAIFDPAVESLKYQFDEMGSFILYLVEHVIKQPVPIKYSGSGLDPDPADSNDHDDVSGYVWLDPADIQGWHVVNHTMAPLSILEKQAQYMILSAAQKDGYITKRRVREQGLDLDEPAQEAAEVLAERMMESEPALADLYRHFQETIEPPEIIEMIEQFMQSLGAQTTVAPTSQPAPTGRDVVASTAGNANNAAASAATGAGGVTAPGGPGVLGMEGMNQPVEVAGVLG